MKYQNSGNGAGARYESDGRNGTTIRDWGREMDDQTAWPTHLQQYPNVMGILLRIDEAFQYARTIVGNDHDALDAVQNAALDVIRRPASVPTDGSSWGWFLRVVRNKAVDLIRARSRKSKKANADLSAADRIVDDEPSWLVLAVTEDNAHELRRALAALDDNYRLVVILKYYDGLDYSEIAEILQISESRARQWAFRGRLELQQALGAEFLHG